MGAKLEGLPHLMTPLPKDSEEYRERTSGISVQLPVLPQNSKDRRSCKATRDNQRSAYEACLAITVCEQILCRSIECGNLVVQTFRWDVSKRESRSGRGRRAELPVFTRHL